MYAMCASLVAAAVADGLPAPSRDEETAILLLLLCWMLGLGVVGGVEDARVWASGVGCPVAGTVDAPAAA